MPYTLRDNLIDVWSFDEGTPASESLTGSVNSYLLGLGRSAIADGGGGAALSTSAGWMFEGHPASTGRRCYNGGGLVDLTDVAGLLQSNLDVMTLAVRWWIGGSTKQVSALGDVDITQADLLGVAGWHSPGDSGPGTGIALYTTTDLDPMWLDEKGGGAGQQVSAWEPNQGSSPYTPRLYVLEIERRNTGGPGGGVHYLCRLARSGSWLGAAVDYQSSVIELDKVCFGGRRFSNGAFAQAAAWSRRLTDAELSEMGESLDLVITPPEPDLPPLTGADGQSVLTFDYANPRVRLRGVLTAGGGPGAKREARNTGARMVRAYTMRITLATAAEIEALRTALASSAGDAGVVRIRHPRDDSGSDPATAPRYRITNAGELEIRRTAGGSRAECSLEIEEI